MVEQVGSGIGRMKDEMKAVKLPAPEFKMDGLFIVVFHRNITEISPKKVRGKFGERLG
jgi:predicted HTH transcriptional regulator